MEFRHESWHQEAVYRLLRRHRVACCVSVGGTIPLREIRTAPFVYVRFHGAPPPGTGRYSDRALRSWAGRLRDLCREGTGYIYFNNDQRGDAVENAARLTDLLTGQDVPGRVPATPRGRR